MFPAGENRILRRQNRRLKLVTHSSTRHLGISFYFHDWKHSREVGAALYIRANYYFNYFQSVIETGYVYRIAVVRNGYVISI